MGFEKGLFIIMGITIALSLVTNIWVATFANEELEAFLANPNFSPNNIPLYDHSLIVSDISNFIYNGITLPGTGWIRTGININLFSLFGAFPNNFIQAFIAKQVALLALLPTVYAIPLLMLIAYSILGLFIVIIKEIINGVARITGALFS